jgi:DNA repair protein RadA/Sms
LVESVVSAGEKRTGDIRKAQPIRLSQIKSSFKTRISSGIKELDRVVGGGLVPGSVILLAGEPGVGKSTLLLQIATHVNGLYVSGEESPAQVKIRAQRLGIAAKELLVLAETEVEVIGEVMKEMPAKTLVVVDSIQTLTNAQLSGTAGSVGQVRECASYLLKIAKSKEIVVFLVGHITKEGAIAGPKVLEHLVDTVLYLEGERLSSFRLLRASKNRFGATDEVGVFEMTDRGMVAVENPSKLFLKKRAFVPGSVVAATMEGTRPLLVEVQALVVFTQLPVPRRVSQGVNYARLQTIVAVLTKILRLPLGGFDVFVNITGGLRIEEPAVDLGVALAIISSFKNLALSPKLVCFGELGLLGEIREVSSSARRQKEARRLGFTQIISPEKFSSISQVAKAISA